MSRPFLALFLLALAGLFASRASGQEIVATQLNNATALTTGTLPYGRLPAGGKYTLVVAGVVINSGTGDKGTFSIPSAITKYRVNGVQVSDCTATPTGSPLVNYWTGAAASGTQVGAFSSANLTANTTTATLTTGTSSASSTLFTGSTISINVATAATGGGPCSFSFDIVDYTGA